MLLKNQWVVEDLKRRNQKILRVRGFPGSPVVRTLFSSCLGPRFDPWLRKQDPTGHAVQQKRKNIYVESSENGNTAIQNLWHTAKAVMREVYSNISLPQETRKKFQTT